MKKNNRNREIHKIDSGFTLIEIMIAIFLIGVALIGALAFFNSSLISGFDTKNELIAAGLAQEGAELVRNFSDYKKLNSAVWSDLVNPATGLPACQRIDHTSLTSHTCYNGSASEDICLGGDGRYIQCPVGGNSIGMTRTLEITCEDGNNISTNCNTPSNVKSLKIVCDVKWNDRTTTATDRLYENNY